MHILREGARGLFVSAPAALPQTPSPNPISLKGKPGPAAPLPLPVLLMQGWVMPALRLLWRHSLESLRRQKQEGATQQVAPIFLYKGLGMGVWGKDCKWPSAPSPFPQNHQFPPFRSYRFSLRQRETRSIPRISAALVLLPFTCLTTQAMYSCSFSSRVENSRR
jgi:hypothetical protein